MLGFLFGVIIYLVVPLALIMFIVIAFLLCGESKKRHQRDTDRTDSAIAGLLSGFTAFIIYAIGTAASRSAFPKFSPSHPPSFDLLAFLIGVVIGFVAPLAIDKIPEMKAMGVSTLILTFAGCAGLYSYLFASYLHRFILYASLSAALGWLLSGIFFRTEAHKLFLDNF
jgi:hypothetical protein